MSKRLGHRLVPVLLALGPVFALGPGAPATTSAMWVRPSAQTAAERDERPTRFDRHWLEPYFTSGAAAAAAERFRREDWRGAITKLQEVSRRLPASSSERLGARYLQALAHAELGEWALARDLFEQLHGVYPVLAPYHAYEAARARLALQDAAGALAWIAKVPAGSVPEAESRLLKMQALAETRQWEAVEGEAGQYLERFTAGPRRPEAMFRQAEAMENLGRDVTRIAALYRRIWAEAPLESWSRRAEERLTVLADEAAAAASAGKKLPGAPAPADLRRFSPSEWLTRGMVFFERNQNERAESAFAAALAEAGPGLAGPAGAQLRCQAEFHRAQSIFKQRQRARAAPAFLLAEPACKQAGNTDLLTKSRYQGARCLASAGERETALKKYGLIEKEDPGHSYADDARLRAAEIHTDEGAPDKAAALLADLPDRYPKGDMLGEAMWRLALAAIREGRWAEAHRWLDENLRRVPREEVWYAEGRAYYWKARVFTRQKDDKQALAAYESAIRKYPLSVYALLSLERMRSEHPKARAALLKELRTPDSPAAASPQFAPRPAYGTPEFRRAVELARLGLGGDARRELARIGFSAPVSRDAARANPPAGEEQQDVYLVTAMLLDRGRSWSAAHAIPRYSLTGFRTDYPRDRIGTLWRLAYPRAFPELIGPACKSNRVPEALQLAIMREESSFNPRVESVANALGLTQMLVKTAARFSDRSVSRETLLDPASNVTLGSRYLGFLLERYNGMPPLAISSYNGGEGAVDRWLRERGNLELDEFIETIPFDETRNYTKRVLSSFITYAWLYDSKRPVPELKFTLKPARAERVGRPPGRTSKSRPR
jgi:soluble lytic murein transglycosylase